MQSPNSQDPRAISGPNIATEMKLGERIISDGTPKSETIIFAAKSDAGKSRFSLPHKQPSSKITNMKHTAAGGCIITFLHVFIFLAKVAEMFWSLLPDKCEATNCRRAGIRGNENRVDGVLMCDYCAYLKRWKQDDAD